jgi:hypothetical protein
MGEDVPPNPRCDLEEGAANWVLMMLGHAELVGSYSTEDDAVVALERLVSADPRLRPRIAVLPLNERGKPAGKAIFARIRKGGSSQFTSDGAEGDKP